MYAYFINSNSLAAPADSKLNAIKQRLAHNKISGEFYLYHDNAELVDYVDKNTSIGAKNFVAIGDDQDFMLLLNAKLDISDITFGFIPTIQKSHLAQLLGIENDRQVYSVLAKRKVVAINMLSVGDKKIVTQLELSLEQNTLIEIIGDRILQLQMQANRLVIRNNLLDEHATKNIVLDAYAKTESSKIDKSSTIRLPHAVKNPISSEPSILHLQANSLQIKSELPLQNVILQKESRVFLIQKATSPANIITSKHSEV
ncbi:MAG TPA: hypothetical protein VHA13_02010 [Gammaproteobacteria bacterium]|nr:hypothetical protein [Gammaproteobacteria bacterium]